MLRLLANSCEILVNTGIMPFLSNYLVDAFRCWCFSLPFSGASERYEQIPVGKYAYMLSLGWDLPPQETEHSFHSSPLLFGLSLCQLERCFAKVCAEWLKKSAENRPTEDITCYLPLFINCGALVWWKSEFLLMLRCDVTATWHGSLNTMICL